MFWYTNNICSLIHENILDFVSNNKNNGTRKVLRSIYEEEMDRYSIKRHEKNIKKYLQDTLTTPAVSIIDT